HTNPPGLRKPLQTRSHVDTIPEYVASLDDHVALVDADPKLDALVLGHLRIPLRHATLDLDTTAQRIHHARELRQHSVPGGLDDSAAMLGDLGIDERLSMGLEPRESAFLVNAHKPAVTGNVSGQDGC